MYFINLLIWLVHRRS